MALESWKLTAEQLDNYARTSLRWPSVLLEHLHAMVDEIRDARRKLAELARLKLEDSRVRPVYEAACAWRDEADVSDWDESMRLDSALIHAIDTARERSEGSGGEGE